MSSLLHILIILSCLICQPDPKASLDQSKQLPRAETQGTSTREADLDLAQRYVPVFYFHPDEVYFPQPVEVLLGLSRLRQDVHLWFDATIMNPATFQGLYGLPSDASYFLDQWFGDTGSSELTNYSSHQAIYESTLSPRAGGLAPVVYAHVVRDEDPGHITIQYWIYYFYNNWFNKHEGDWELVEAALDSNAQPEWTLYSQHHGGVRRSWATTPREGDTHPVVYVARGSHANYYAANEVYPNVKDIGNRRLVLVDRTGTSERMQPAVILIPSRAELAADPASWPGLEWLMFRGRWGETGFYSDLNGPYGPADKGFQWDQPLAWGLSQPLDADTWYKNRLRVVVTGPAQEQAQVWLADETGQSLPQMESLGEVAISHSNPPGLVLADVNGMPGAHGEVNVSWPDPLSQVVTLTSYSGFELDSSGHAQVELSAGEAQMEISAGRGVSLPGSNPVALQAARIESFKPVWDAPDSVLVGNILPFHQILWGFLLALLYSLVPVMILIGILYWVDRYQREPVRMLAFAFFWGAIPALVIALSLQLFFKLPPDMLGLNALQAVRLGLLAPVLEEIMKAAGVLFIYWRRRREINDVLDGMIYGAIVGFGFAFLSNLLRLGGNFFAFGFSAFNPSLIAERTVHVLDHGLYTAIFGAGLGYAISAKNRRQFWSWIAGALCLAIITHGLHNLLANSTVGLNIFTLIVTSLGVVLLFAVAGWSLVMQRRLLRQELQGLVHDSLYYSIQGPLGRTGAQWTALRRQGFRAWLQVRRLQGLCIKLAHSRLQARLFPEKYSAEDDSALQAEIKRVFERMRLLSKENI